MRYASTVPGITEPTMILSRVSSDVAERPAQLGTVGMALSIQAWQLADWAVVVEVRARRRTRRSDAQRADGERIVCCRFCMCGVDGKMSKGRVEVEEEGRRSERDEESRGKKDEKRRKVSGVEQNDKRYRIQQAGRHRFRNKSSPQVEGQCSQTMKIET